MSKQFWTYASETEVTLDSKVLVQQELDKVNMETRSDEANLILHIASMVGIPQIHESDEGLLMATRYSTTIENFANPNNKHPTRRNGVSDECSNYYRSLYESLLKEYDAYRKSIHSQIINSRKDSQIMVQSIHQEHEKGQEKLRVENRKLHDEVNVLKRELSELQYRNKSFKSEMKLLKTDLHENKIIVEELRCSDATLKSRCSALTLEKNILLERVASTLKRTEHYYGQLEELGSHNENLIISIGKIREEHVLNMQKLRDEKDSVYEGLDMEKKALENTIADLLNLFEEQVEYYISLLDEIKRQQSVKSKQIKTVLIKYLEKAIKEAQQITSALEKKVNGSALEIGNKKDCTKSSSIKDMDKGIDDSASHRLNPKLFNKITGEKFFQKNKTQINDTASDTVDNNMKTPVSITESEWTKQVAEMEHTRQLHRIHELESINEQRFERIQRSKDKYHKLFHKYLKYKTLVKSKSCEIMNSRLGTLPLEIPSYQSQPDQLIYQLNKEMEEDNIKHFQFVAALQELRDS